MSHKPIKAHFICGGKFHDMQFARLQILQMLYENERIYTTVAEDYSDIAAIESADVLIAYTCDVVPSADALEAIKGFFAEGNSLRQKILFSLSEALHSSLPQKILFPLLNSA